MNLALWIVAGLMSAAFAIGGKSALPAYVWRTGPRVLLVASATVEVAILLSCRSEPLSCEAKGSCRSLVPG